MLRGLFTLLEQWSASFKNFTKPFSSLVNFQLDLTVLTLLYMKMYRLALNSVNSTYFIRDFDASTEIYWSHCNRGSQLFQLCADCVGSRRKTVFVSAVIDKNVCWVTSTICLIWLVENTAVKFCEKWNLYKIWVYKSQQDAHVTEFIFVWELLYTFRVSLSPVFRSTKQL